MAAILVLFIMADRKKMIPSTLLWPSAIFLKKMELMFSIQELTTNMRHLLKRQLMLTTQALIFSCQYIETLLKSPTSILVLKLLYTMIQDLSQRLQETSITSLRMLDLRIWELIQEKILWYLRELRCQLSLLKRAL